MRFFMAAFPAYDEVWVQLLAMSSVLTMTVGNLLALWQRNIKRMLAYSSIAQAGYALLGEDGHLSTSLLIEGSLDDPKVKTQVTQDILLTPFNIIKRTIKWPFKVIDDLQN